MNINHISGNKISRIYGKNNKQNVKSINKTKGDTLEISSMGKTMSNYALDIKNVHSKHNIEKIRTEVSNGTYNRSSKLIAKKMIDVMRENK